MSAPTTSRFPFEPITTETRGATIDTIATTLGVSRRTIHRWINHGIPEQQADRTAIALGTHPACLSHPHAPDRHRTAAQPQTEPTTEPTDETPPLTASRSGRLTADTGKIEASCSAEVTSTQPPLPKPLGPAGPLTDVRPR